MPYELCQKKWNTNCIYCMGFCIYAYLQKPNKYRGEG